MRHEGTQELAGQRWKKCNRAHAKVLGSARPGERAGKGLQKDAGEEKNWSESSRKRLGVTEAL